MPAKELTDDQRQRRAEIARQNGAKSKGPVTAEGKYRSSLNVIATGEHVELHKEDLPPFFFLLSTDDRSAYLRAFQAQMRHLKPQSEFEQSLVRRMAIALFQHDRLTNFHAEALQRELGAVVREFPALGLSDHFFLSNKRATLENAHRPKRVRCARVPEERTGRAGPAPTGEERAPPAGPKRVRCARVPEERTGRAGPAPTGEELAPPAGPKRVRCARVPQKKYFSAIWIDRGGSVAVMRPKLAGAFRLAAGPPQLTRLKALNNSVRNCSVWRS